ncbi:hypothetical protein AAMO2058_001345700 [Amorphochlora amoebiformis]
MQDASGGSGGEGGEGKYEASIPASRLTVEESSELRHQVEQLKRQLAAREKKIANYEAKYLHGGLEKQVHILQLDLQQAREIISQQQLELDQDRENEANRVTLQDRLQEMQQIMNNQDLEHESEHRQMHAHQTQMESEIQNLREALQERQQVEIEKDALIRQLQEEAEGSRKVLDDLKVKNNKLKDGRRIKELEALASESKQRLELGSREIEALKDRLETAEASTKQYEQKEKNLHDEMLKEVEDAIQIAQKDNHLLQKQLVEAKQKISEMDRERDTIVRAAETSGKQVITLTAQLDLLSKEHGMEKLLSDLHEAKVTIRKMDDEHNNLIAELNKFQKNSQLLMRDREYLLQRCGLPYDWQLDARATTDIESEQRRLRADVEAHKRTIETLERQRSEVLEQLHKQAIGVSEKGFVFLGLTPEQTVKVHDYADALKTGREVKFSGRDKEYENQITELKTQVEEWKERHARASLIWDEERADLRKSLLYQQKPPPPPPAPAVPVKIIEDDEKLATKEDYKKVIQLLQDLTQRPNVPAPMSPPPLPPGKEVSNTFQPLQPETEAETETETETEKATDKKATENENDKNTETETETKQKETEAKEKSDERIEKLLEDHKSEREAWECKQKLLREELESKEKEIESLVTERDSFEIKFANLSTSLAESPQGESKPEDQPSNSPGEVKETSNNAKTGSKGFLRNTADDIVLMRIKKRQISRRYNAMADRHKDLIKKHQRLEVDVILMESELRSRLYRVNHSNAKLQATMDSIHLERKSWVPKSQLSAARYELEQSERCLAISLEKASAGLSAQVTVDKLINQRIFLEKKIATLEADLFTAQEKLSVLKSGEEEDKVENASRQTMQLLVENWKSKAMRYEGLFEKAQEQCKGLEHKAEELTNRLHNAVQESEKMAARCNDLQHITKADLEFAREAEAIAAQQGVQAREALERVQGIREKEEETMKRLEELLDLEQGSDEQALVGKLTHELMTARSDGVTMENNLLVEQGRRHRLESRLCKLEAQIEFDQHEIHRIWSNQRFFAASVEKAQAALLKKFGHERATRPERIVSLSQAKVLYDASETLSNRLKELQTDIASHQGLLEESDTRAKTAETENQILREQMNAYKDAKTGNLTQVHIRIDHWGDQIKEQRLKQIKAAREAQVLRKRIEFYKKTVSDAENQIDQLHAIIAQKEEELGSREIERHNLLLKQQESLREQEGRLRARFQEILKGKAPPEFYLDEKAANAHKAKALADKHNDRLETKLKEYRQALKTTKRLVLDQDELILNLRENVRQLEAKIEHLQKVGIDQKELNELERKRVMSLTQDRIESMQILLRQKSQAAEKYQKLLKEAQMQYLKRATEDEKEIERLTNAFRQIDQASLEKIDGALDVLNIVPSVPHKMVALETYQAHIAEKDSALAELEQRLEEQKRMKKMEDIVREKSTLASEKGMEEKDKTLRGLHQLVLKQKAEMEQKDKLLKDQAELLHAKTQTLNALDDHVKSKNRKLNKFDKALMLLKDQMLEKTNTHVEEKGELERRLSKVPQDRLAQILAKEKDRLQKKIKMKEEARKKAVDDKQKLQERIEQLEQEQQDDKKTIQNTAKKLQNLHQKVRNLDRELGEQRGKCMDLIKRKRSTARELGISRGKVEEMGKKFADEKAKLEAEVSRLEEQIKKQNSMFLGMSKQKSPYSSKDMSLIERKARDRVNGISRKLGEKEKELEATRLRLAAALKDKSNLTAKISTLRQRLAKKGPKPDLQAALRQLEDVGSLRKEIYEAKSEADDLREQLGEAKMKYDKQLAHIQRLESQLQVERKDKKKRSKLEKMSPKGLVESIEFETPEEGSSAPDISALKLDLHDAKTELAFCQEQRAAEKARSMDRIYQLQEEVNSYKKLAKVSASSQPQIKSTCPSAWDKEKEGLERVINALKKVVSRLQTENAMLAKNSFRTQKYQDLQRENKIMKNKLSAKKQLARSGDAKKDLEIRRLQELQRQSRKNVKKEQEISQRARTKLKSVEEQLTKFTEMHAKTVKKLEEVSKRGAKQLRSLQLKVKKQVDSLQKARSKVKEQENIIAAMVAKLPADVEPEPASQTPARKTRLIEIKRDKEKLMVQELKDKNSKLVEENLTLFSKNKQLAENNDKLMEELGAFDDKFFEEVEDLKYEHDQLMKENESLKREIESLRAASNR